jgi:uncharacterized membrane protein
LPHVFLLVALAGSALGFLFAAVSTYDFVAHLDRQVHGLHCSFLPGMSTPDASGASGCHLTMMSPYSSFLRESIWGGVPIALPAMAVFAFLFFWGALLFVTDRTRDPRATGFYLLATGLPVIASLGMATVAVRELDAFCKLCVGIYFASALTALGAFLMYRRAKAFWSEGQGTRAAQKRALGDERTPLSYGALCVAFAFGVLFVGSSSLVYALKAPAFDKYVGSCGTLPKPADPQRVMLTLSESATGPVLVEVLDPLCAACRAFERRFDKLALKERARRTVLLFPLDNSCNWMVDRAIHPGACAISEALLCAERDADDVLAWAFDQQEELIAAETATAGSAAKRVVAKFPALAGCVGSSKVRARLNRSLRWAVDNQLPVLTPQLYVDGKRLCDADTDLGLDYMLTRLAAPKAAP